jgi:hypothetical protein
VHYRHTDVNHDVKANRVHQQTGEHFPAVQARVALVEMVFAAVTSAHQAIKSRFLVSNSDRFKHKNKDSRMK